jgi:uncharacterized protein DUF3168
MSAEIETALYTALQSAFSGRVYPQRLPDQPTYPCLRYYVVGGGPLSTMCGRTNLNNYRYRFDIYARTQAEVLSLRDAVVTAMDSFGFKSVSAMELDGYEPEVNVMRRTLDYSIWQNVVS